MNNKILIEFTIPVGLYEFKRDFYLFGNYFQSLCISKSLWPCFKLNQRQVSLSYRSKLIQVQ